MQGRPTKLQYGIGAIGWLAILGVLIAIVWWGVLPELPTEGNAWRKACHLDNIESDDAIEAYQDFVRKYPASEHVATAEQRIEDLKLWSWAECANTAESYGEYLSRFPEGRRNKQAKTSLNVFELNQESIDKEYDDMAPLIQKLRAATKPPKGLTFPEAKASDTTLLPLNKRLLHIQRILFPELQPGSPVGPTHFYLTLDYERGKQLTWSIRSIRPVVRPPDAKEVVLIVKLYAVKDGSAYLLNEARHVGNSGNSFAELVSWPVNRVMRDIEVMPKMKMNVEGFKDVVETTIGYATGLHLPSRGFTFSQRKATLEVASTSDDWADRDFATQALLELEEEQQNKCSNNW